MSFRTALVFATLALGGACAEPEPPRPSGQFGVFYGEQVQERAELALESLREGQLGFLVSVPPGYEGRRVVRAKITRPGPLGRRVTEHLEFGVPSGKNEFSERVSVPSGAIGVWNVRVVIDDTLVVDRAILVRRRTSG